MSGPGNTSPVGSMGRAAEATRLVNHALQWEPYGGGDEYILPEFGIPPQTYYRRILRLLQSVHAPRLEAIDRQKIVAICLRKLGIPDATPGAEIRIGALSYDTLNADRRASKDQP
ncbi:hypothetical protein ACFTZB_34875 [Rhodococcus sp. NPDC057014]|uniref:hypothetical protein n=1 Tax=Rhodococcus sp. NPDC057014 TaxID=3346000 RepID=UPI0036456A3E